MEGNMKVNNPGPFTKDKEWIHWEEKFLLFLQKIPGITGIPLTYVVRKAEYTPMSHDKSYLDTIEEQAPLVGHVFAQDARAVHDYLKNFLTGQPAYEWIRPVEGLANGREDMKRLRIHYSGAGNNTRRLAHAQHLWDTTVYHSEGGQFKFEQFLQQCQKCFNIFQECGFEKSQREQVLYLLEPHRINSEVLKPMLPTLEIEEQRRAGTQNPLTFNDAATALSTFLSKKESQKAGRKVAQASSSGKRKGKPNDKPGNKRKRLPKGQRSRESVIDPVLGEIGWRNDFASLSPDMQQRIRQARDARGMMGGTRKFNVSAAASANPAMSSVAEIVDAVSSRVIGALCSGAASTDAGDAFGGQAQAACDRANRN
jgi:hypothetical protein